MAESKRIFNRAKMNRDIDDRLLPEGEYRYALNVNIGESEGGDIGALENLKGNEQIGSVEGGTTIGVVRDPNSDRVYWFNKGTQFDAIYEYDQRTNTVNTILKDSVARDNVKPTCVPDFNTLVNDPDGDSNDRPDISFRYSEGIEGCMMEFGPNGRRNTNYNPSATYQTTTVCTEAAAPPPPVTGDPFTLADANVRCDGQIPQAGTSSPGDHITSDHGTVTVTSPASIPANTSTSIIMVEIFFTVTGTIPTGFEDEGDPIPSTGFSGSVMCPQLGTTVPDTHTWQLATTDNTNAGVTASGVDGPFTTTEGITYMIPSSSTSIAEIDDTTTMQWADPPNLTATLDAASVALGITISSVNVTAGSTNPANVTLGGSFSPTGDVTSTVTWSGGDLALIPVPSLTATIEDPVAGTLGVDNIENSHGYGPLTVSGIPGAWTITFTVTGSGWVQDFPNDADFWLQQGASAGANQLQSVSGTGDSNGVYYWEADRNFGTSSRSGQLQLRTGTATGTIVDTIDFTQDA